MKDVTKLYRQFQRKVMQIDPPCMTQPESFYPEDFGSPNEERSKYNETMRSAIKVAKKLCAQCPIKQECLEYAVEAEEEWGIWGGLTARER